MNNITDKEAELLILNFKNNSEIIDQNGRGNGRVTSIENGVCVVEFENGDIMKHEHHLFYKN